MNKESYNFHNYLYQTSSYDAQFTLGLVEPDLFLPPQQDLAENLFNNDFVNSLSIPQWPGGKRGIASMILPLPRFTTKARIQRREPTVWPIRCWKVAQSEQGMDDRLECLLRAHLQMAA